jgi:hypothetical protein
MSENTDRSRGVHYRAAVHRAHRADRADDPALLNNLDARAADAGIGTDGYPLDYPDSVKRLDYPNGS